MKYCCGALLFALVSSCSVSAQVPSSDELIQMAASEAGQKKIFAELKKVATSWDDWPHHDDVHKAMLGHYLAIAENPKAAVADRVTALRGIQNSRIHWLSEESAEKKRVDALKSGLMAESNP